MTGRIDWSHGFERKGLNNVSASETGVLIIIIIIIIIIIFDTIFCGSLRAVCTFSQLMLICPRSLSFTFLAPCVDCRLFSPVVQSTVHSCSCCLVLGQQITFGSTTFRFFKTCLASAATFKITSNSSFSTAVHSRSRSTAIRSQQFFYTLLFSLPPPPFGSLRKFF